jgi:hypothetical protein
MQRPTGDSWGGVSIDHLDGGSYRTKLAGFDADCTESGQGFDTDGGRDFMGGATDTPRA